MAWRTGLRLAGLLLTATGALASSGCLLVAGGAAASGAAGYAYYKGNVSDTYDADFLTTWHASHDALYDLGLPVKGEAREANHGTIESMTAKGDKIRIHVEAQPAKIPSDNAKTRVGVRVATFGDEEVSKRILAQIGQRAGSVRVIPANPSNPGVPTESEAVSSWKQTDVVRQATGMKEE